MKEFFYSLGSLALLEYLGFDNPILIILIIIVILAFDYFLKRKEIQGQAEMEAIKIMLAKDKK